MTTKISIQDAVQLSMATPLVTYHYEGSPGVGKTYAPYEILTRAGYDVEIVNAQNMLIEDMSRLPTINDDKTVSFLCADTWRPRPKRAFIIDELFKAPEDVVNAFLPLAYGSPRTLMGNTYDDDTIVIITSNSAEFRVGDKFRPHMGNRICTLQIADPSVGEATTVMLNRGIDARIIRWVENCPQALVSYDPAAKTKADTELSNYFGYDERHPRQKFVSMRALENVSHIIKTVPSDFLRIAVAGLIGDKAATSLTHFLLELGEFVPLEHMVKDPENCRVPDKIFDQRIAALTAASGLDKTNWKALLQYANRLNPELKHVFLCSAARKTVSAELISSSKTWANEMMKLL